MRTTLNLEDDVLCEAKRYADARSLPLGKAVSNLVRRGLSTPIQTRVVNGIQVVVLPTNTASSNTRLTRAHHFWPDDVSLVDALLRTKGITGHRHITDACLLALAAHRRGTLATLDRGLGDLAKSVSVKVEMIE